MRNGRRAHLAIPLVLGLAGCSAGDKPAETPPAMGATPAPAADPCASRSPDGQAPVSIVWGTGRVTAGKWTVAMSSVVSGYATSVTTPLRDKNQELRIYLGTRANACGRVRNGIATSGEPLIAIEMATSPNTKVEPRAYPNVRVGLDGVKEGLPAGACNGAWPIAERGSGVKGTLTITSIDSTHVTGRYVAEVPSDAGAEAGEPSVSFEFDVPFCGAKLFPQCCAP